MFRLSVLRRGLELVRRVISDSLEVRSPAAGFREGGFPIARSFRPVREGKTKLGGNLCAADGFTLTDDRMFSVVFRGTEFVKRRLKPVEIVC